MSERDDEGRARHPYARDRTTPIEPPPPAIVPQPEPATVLDLPREDAVVHAVEQVIGRLLRVGVILSLVLVVVGSLTSFYHGRYGHTPADVARLTRGTERGPTSPHAFLEGLEDLRGQSLIVAGLIVLMLTPIIRVAVSIIAFAIQRDFTFVVITSIVLALLVLSCVFGVAHG